MRKLATPGAVVMLAGVVLLYWGLGILRGEQGGSNTARIMRTVIPKRTNSSTVSRMPEGTE